MKVIILKYSSGNIKSLFFSLKRIGIEAIITDNYEEILSSDKIILPGVAEARSAMKYLKKKKLDIIIPNLKQPVLGICLGLQLLCNFSEENNTTCLGIFNLSVKKFKYNKKVKIPHIGWNNINKLKGPLFKKIHEGVYQYFIHSYYIPLCKYTTSQSKYIIPYSSSLKKKNFYGIQFHPEKSSYNGQKILENFINL
jgi:glutamine amidotransferase